MARSSNAGNILVALQLATLIAEAQSGDPDAQLEAVQEVLQFLATRIAYLRNNPEFAKALIDLIEKEISRRHPQTPAPVSANTTASPEGV